MNGTRQQVLATQRDMQFTADEVRRAKVMPTGQVLVPNAKWGHTLMQVGHFVELKRLLKMD